MTNVFGHMTRVFGHMTMVFGHMTWVSAVLRKTWNATLFSWISSFSGRRQMFLESHLSVKFDLHPEAGV